jgi:predicted nucleotidyltransferase
MAALCLRFGVATLYVFGSRGREVLDWLHGRTGAISGESDVDVGVRPVSGRVWTLDDKVAMAIALEDLLGCGRVDLVVLAEADPFLAAEIIRGERLYAHDEYAADEYDLYVLRRAGDLIPLERERIALLLRSET